MAATYEPIASTTLGSNAASVTFGSGGTLPQTYTDILLVISARAATSGHACFRFNSDTGSNYSTTRLHGLSNGGATSARNSNDTFIRGSVVNNGMSTTNPSIYVVNIMSYANTNVYKTTLEAGGLGATEVNRHVGLWRDTSAITSIDIVMNNGANFKSGDTFSLYGIKAA